MATALVAGLALAACRAEPATSLPEPAESRTEPAAPRVAPSGLDLIPLTIHAGQTAHHFTVEVARSVDEQARGLMYREHLGPNEGMLFPLSPPRAASFWMKNTFIPLDMIFIRGDGTIARIAANTVPHSTAPVAVGEPVTAVLEIPGGRAAELGIHEGDRVNWQDRMPR